MSKLVRRAAVPRLVLFSLFALSLILPLAATAQALPPVGSFVSYLDVRCYKIPNQPPLNLPLQLDHLNPLFVEKGFPTEHVNVQSPQELCVPVAKNGNYPPADTLPFIRYVDWKCYGITGPSLDYQLHVDHLNPVIRQMFGPGDDIWVREPQQVCVPVMKNNAAPPAEVRRLVQWLDVKCYRAESTYPAAGAITLNHLNPLFSAAAAEVAKITGPAQQLCVPVAKNGRIPPSEVLTHVAYSDVLCYPLSGLPLNKQLTLRHLNPVLIDLGLPAEFVPVTESTKLCVPVAKDGRFPPTAAGSTASTPAPANTPPAPPAAIAAPAPTVH
jgi:hypothetical protein